MSQPAHPLTWSTITGPDLDPQSLYDVLALRAAVFVVEQDCAYQDVDGRDLLEATVHVTGRGADDAITAYARVLAPDADHRAARIGRVIVARQARGRGVANELMTRALEVCEQRWPGEPVELGAQAHLTGFYGAHGFRGVGAPYVEDGIPHQWMRRD